MRRAAYSVAANIVEGIARRSLKERVHFLNIAEASLAEAGYCLHVAKRLGYIETIPLRLPGPPRSPIYRVSFRYFTRCG